MNTRCFENDQEPIETGASCMCPPIYECPEERVCERYIIHDVTHVKPINTKIINHHIYRHTMTPTYTCEECDTCENIYEMNKKF